MSANFPCRSLLASALLALGVAASAQTGNVAINASGAPAQPTALLDVSSVSQGIFLPRFPSLPAAAALPDGLTVYKTGAGRGFYVVQSGAWVMLQPGNDGWDLYGNYLTNPINPNPDFIGTTDNRPMYFSTNNTHRMRLDATTGHLGVGWPIAQPAFKERLDIKGGIRQYYVPPIGVETSNTNLPGVFRYQTLGTWTGTAPYKYGSNEKMAVNSASTPVINSVLGTTHNFPLQYAGHWGNVGDTSMFQGTNFPVVKQPATNGWRAFENPYNEVTDQSWSHFREATCTTVPTYSIIPSGVPTPYTYSNTIANGPNDFVTPFISYDAGRPSMRRQYLFRAEELNMELAQLNGNTDAVNGLCPGKPITQVGFFVNANTARTALSTLTISLTIRHAPLGLEELNGFDNTPDYDGTKSCGNMTTTAWPGTAIGTPSWRVVNLVTPFTWDGVSNILIEVAVKYQTGTANINNNPVACTNTGFNASYGANITNLTSVDQVPLPVPESSCANGTNQATRMADNSISVGWASGASTWRPLVRFLGEVAVASTAPTSGVNNANYLQYPGALVLEDTSTVSSTIPWGRRRENFPPGNTYFSYRGKGTISAQYGVFDNSSRLNDHVFDRAFDGRVAPGDAADFGGDRLLSIGEMEAFTRRNRHLPTMKGRQAWKTGGGFSLGDLTNQLWTTAETHALYVADLHDKLNVIEMLTNDRPITAAEFQVARQDLASMTDLTDADKARLIADLRKRVTLTSTSR